MAFDRTATSWEDRFREAAERAFADDLAALLDIVNRHKSGKAVVNWEQVNLDAIAYLSTRGQENWRKVFLPAQQGVIGAQGEVWASVLGRSFDVRNLLAEAWFDEYTLKFAQEVNETTKKGLGTMFQQAQKEGWTIPQMEERMGTMFAKWMTGKGTSEDFEWYADRMPPWRRELIARTEILRSSNSGVFHLFRSWGTRYKEWLATYDPPRAREDHMRAGERYVEGGNPGPIPIDERFEVGGVRMLHPHDPSAPIEQVANCRCSITPYSKAWSELGAETEEMQGFGGNAYFSDDIGTATGRAVHGGDILFSREDYAQLSEAERRYVIAHEMAHQTVEPYVLGDNDEWDLAEEILTIMEVRGRRLFAGGNFRIGESVADATAAMLTESPFGNMSREKWGQIATWAREVTARAGYSPGKLRRNIEQIRGMLDAQLMS